MPHAGACYLYSQRPPCGGAGPGSVLLSDAWCLLGASTSVVLLHLPRGGKMPKESIC